MFHIIKLENREVISNSWPPCLCLWSYVYGFQDFVHRFSKINIFGTATEKELRRHIYVLMDVHVMSLKHPNKLFEAKLWTLLFLICFIFERFSRTCFTINIKWNCHQKMFPSIGVSKKRSTKNTRTIPVKELWLVIMLQAEALKLYQKWASHTLFKDFGSVLINYDLPPTIFYISKNHFRHLLST